ncbi:hypothetical protein ACUHMQ_21090, partial [Chitinimonas sp. PSY-7]|uniref:hypothetical protein n=1 Tax=Chitinimonas sp. PSY-7 TaxID=3459088 RepID=UPI0040400386
RQASGNFNRVEMLEAAEACKGDVKDEAVSLVQYLTEPKEEAAVLRGYMFLHFLGGSVASAAVNLTQPAIMTFPYLSQFGGPAKAAKRLSSAASRIYAKRHAPDLAKVFALIEY